MNAKLKAELASSVAGFSLPGYDELPGGLYLEQTTKYIADLLRPLQENAITASMISNYVKKGLVSRPVKKQYYPDQIAHLIFIAVVKIVLSMDDIQLLVNMQKRSYSDRVAYEYFRMEMENILSFVFGAKESPDSIGVEDTLEKHMLRSTITAAATKIFLEKSFALLDEISAEEGSAK